MESFEQITMSYKCPRALNTLKPCQSNWYCDGCRQMVYDFRGMSEADILNAFKQSGQKLCGIYDAERIRVLPRKPTWHKWLSAAMVFLGVSSIHQTIFAQNTPIGKVLVKPRVEKDTLLTSFVGMIAPLPPEVPGGNTAFINYLHRHIENKYKFRGLAEVTFRIANNGKIVDTRLEKGTNTILDTAIINALKNAPAFKPETPYGMGYLLRYSLPVDFKN